jgi:hypothetical protein
VVIETPAVRALLERAHALCDWTREITQNVTDIGWSRPLVGGESYDEPRVPVAREST